MSIRFYIYTAGYNCSQYVQSCLESVNKQTYKNYVHVVVDDSSTDDTYGKCNQFKSSNTKVFKTSKNGKWLKTASQFCCPNKDDVVVCLDLDDALYNEHTLAKIAKIYETEGCWLTYGSYMRLSTPQTVRCHCRVYPAGILANRDFRQYSFITSHLRTYRGFLWQGINQEHFKDWDGNFADMAYDCAIMFPMLEMCAPGKIRFVEEMTYWYNDLNPLGDSRRSRELQKRTETWFRAFPKYNVLQTI